VLATRNASEAVLAADTGGGSPSAALRHHHRRSKERLRLTGIRTEDAARDRNLKRSD